MRIVRFRNSQGEEIVGEELGNGMAQRLNGDFLGATDPVRSSAAPEAMGHRLPPLQPTSVLPQLIAFLSQDTTLLPGTVILTGTPQGVGFARKPPRWLKPGDRVVVEIKGIGRLENPVVAADDD